MGMELPENWNFYMAFAFFRLAAMLQGLHKHSLAGEKPNHTGPALQRSSASSTDTQALHGELSH